MDEELEKKIFEVLESIGLHRNEITVYLDLIKHEGSSAHEISRRTKIHRSNVYDILEKSIKKGIATQGIKDNKKIFFPIEPKDLLNYVKQKEYDLEKLIPEMEKIHHHVHEPRKVKMSEGIKSFRLILNDLLNKKETIFVYGIPKGVKDIIGGFLKEFHKKRIKEKIVMKHIYNKGALERIKVLNKMKCTEAKYLPSDYDTTITTLICGDVVLLNFWEEPIFTITITNKTVAESYKRYFDILWSQAKKK